MLLCAGKHLRVATANSDEQTQSTAAYSSDLQSLDNMYFILIGLIEILHLITLKTSTSFDNMILINLLFMSPVPPAGEPLEC